MDSSQPEFHLGLVLAGGATRGAYTAGVLDFLLEVLSEWEKAKKEENVALPPWTVKIQNMVSSSAGALASVLATASITSNHEPVAHHMKFDDDQPQNNLLYRGWVSEFNAERIFDCSDLPSLDVCRNRDCELKSLLNSSFMMDIARELTRYQSTDQPVPSWARDLQLYFTVLNTRGIPYKFELDVSLDKSMREYHMLSHSDCIGFDTGPKKNSKLAKLDLHEVRSSPSWRSFFETAVASASIPVVFPSVVLSRPLHHYEKEETNAVQPSWPEGMPSTYRFNASDGGLLDNEPVGISRNSLELSAKQKGMEPSPEKCWGAILLVDTGSNQTDKIQPNRKVRQSTLWDSIIHTSLAVRMEANLKDEELLKARDSNDFSQYIISPVHAKRLPGEQPLATDTFMKFGGALHKKIRHHDFMLGRRNCQEFLRNHFVLDVDKAQSNPTFKNVKECIKSDQKIFPIIPLFGKASEECMVPDWPEINEQERKEIIENYDKLMKNRVERVLTILARNFNILEEPTSWWRLWANMWRAAVWKIIEIITNFIANKARDIVQEALLLFDKKKENK